MEQEEFCDKYCPIPFRWAEFPKIDNDFSIDCDLESNDCPFKDVDFSRVTGRAGTYCEWWVEDVAAPKESRWWKDR